jgi:thiamine biosynthesis protein ThiS
MSEVEISVNGRPRAIEAGATVSTLLESLALDPRQVAVEVNLELAPRGEHATRRLSAGDRVEVVTLVGGG